MLKESVNGRIRVEPYMKTICLYELFQIPFSDDELVPLGILFHMRHTGRDIRCNCYR